MILLGFESPLEHQKESLAFRRGILFSVAPGESKFIPDRGNPRWSTKKNLSPFGGGFFFRSLPGSRSLSPAGEIPAGAPKNLCLSPFPLLLDISSNLRKAVWLFYYTHAYFMFTFSAHVQCNPPYISVARSRFSLFLY